MNEAILEHFQPGPLARPVPGPPTNLTGRPWAKILKPAKIFLARARPEMLFLVVLHYKMRGRPAQARAQPEPGPKIEARRTQWDGHGQVFRPEITEIFLSPARTRPGPKNAQV
jgi:hypothetical protein